MSLSKPDFARIGIIGGGQLGRMMILAGTPLGFEFAVLTPEPDDPGARLADVHIRGTLYDPEAIREITGWADVTTYEIEHIDTGALLAAERNGALIMPRPALLETINDKYAQKSVLERAGVPVPAFREELDRTVGKPVFPVVQKLRRGGYDGRGVKVLASADDAPLVGESYFEEVVDFDRELSVVVARSSAGEVTAYPVVEMEFDAEANICSRVVAPARVSTQVQSRARKVAMASVEAIDGVGVIAVELFLTRNGDILVNEIAPRPHNSGHLTIEASATSQFEQHLRAIVGLPLGPTTLRSPAVMVNVLGAPEADGRPRLPELADLLGRPGVHLHWYGKRRVRPYRKMGHVTVIAEDLEAALAMADEVELLTRVAGSSAEGGTNGS